jgi:hypothetical protein
VTGTSYTARRDWRGQLTNFLLGAATGIGLNQFTGATAYRAIGASVALAALLTALTWLRTLPERAPLVRYTVRTMLALGFLAALGVVFGPHVLTPYMLFGAVGLTGAAVLIPTDHTEKLLTLAGVAAVGVGVAGIGVGVADLVRGELLLGVADVGSGVTIAWAGVALLGRSKLPARVTNAGLEIALMIQRKFGVAL